MEMHNRSDETAENANCSNEDYRSDQLLGEKSKFFINKYKKLYILKWVCVIVAALLVSAAAVVVIVCTLRAEKAFSDMDAKLTEYITQCRVGEGKSGQRVVDTSRAKAERIVQNLELTTVRPDSVTPLNSEPENTLRSSQETTRLAGDGADFVKDFLLNFTDGINDRFVGVVRNLSSLERSTKKMHASLREVIVSVDDSKASVGERLSRLDTRIEEMGAALNVSSTMNSELKNVSMSVFDAVKKVKDSLDENKNTSTAQFFNLTDAVSKLVLVSNASSQAQSNKLSELFSGVSMLTNQTFVSSSKLQGVLDSVDTWIVELQTSLLNESASIKEEFRSEVLEKVRDSEKHSATVLLQSVDGLNETREKLQREYEQTVLSINLTISQLSESVLDWKDRDTTETDLDALVLSVLDQASTNISDGLLSLQQKFENMEETVSKVEEEITTQREVNLCSYRNGCELKSRASKKFQCYKVFQRIRLTWADARKKCLSLGGYLAEIHDHVSLEYVKRVVTIGSSRLWIGASDDGKEGTWTWVTSNKHLAVEDWHRNQPDNHKNSEHCMEINKGLAGKYWNDLPCHLKIGYICQKDGDDCEGWM
ncbi:CD209 antigen [Aplysia californica]|uniref:CD209 antigen n=1 Tax=Aplysia californica TaxID=6500 RepID=A0ABM0K5H7_APLCA|nr:CD209 antigen [Aplysia californica]